MGGGVGWWTEGGWPQRLCVCVCNHAGIKLDYIVLALRLNYAKNTPRSNPLHGGVKESTTQEQNVFIHFIKCVDLDPGD